MTILHLFVILNLFLINNTYGLDLNNISEEVSKIDLYNQNCSHQLGQITRTVFDIEDDLNKETISKATYESIQVLFNQRLKIKTLVDLQTVDKKINQVCWTHVRRLIYSIRNLEDSYIHSISRTKKASYNEYLEFEGEPWYFFKNEQFQFNSRSDVRSGDVILSIGKDYTSAGISKIGKQESSFSHLSMVYKDQNNKLMTIEAHGERGVVVRPISAHYSERDQISVLLRHKDPTLAKKAAELIYDMAIYRQRKNKHIQYDFGMDYNDPKTLFCSEVIFLAYKLATDNKLDIAPYKTTFKEGHIEFLQKFGLNISKKNFKEFNTFGPGDIQWNPDFDIVAEWKNPIGIESARIKGIVVKSIFNWVDDYKYIFKNTKFNKFVPKVAVKVRKVPYYNFKTKNKRFLLDNLFGKNLKSKQITLYLMIDYLGLIIEEKLMRDRKKNASLMSYRSITKQIQQLREIDLSRYKYYKLLKQKRKKALRKLKRFSRKTIHFSKQINKINKELKLTKPLFHKYFHPSKTTLKNDAWF